MTSGTNRSQCCKACARSLKCCSLRENVVCCSKRCEGEHWQVQKTEGRPYVCGSIHKEGQEFSKEMVKRQFGERDKISTVRQLVGRKCLIRCFLGNKRIEALWDSGSQVCAIDELWRDINLPEVPLRDVSELTNQDEPLHLEAANGTEMPYIGWVEVPFKLTANDPELLIPVLVLKNNQQQCPIIGYNVIEHLVSEIIKDGTDSEKRDNLLRAVGLAFPHLKKKTKSQAS